jgi:hypothetical protein
MLIVHRTIQATFPMLLLAMMTLSVMLEHEAGALPFAVVFAVWVACACILSPGRAWSWWLCFAPLVVCAAVGLALFGGLIHMFLFPDFPTWTQMNQPGAIAILAGTLFFVPSALLLWHLYRIRGLIRGTPRA